MQSISQTSLKLEAHKDKVINHGASNTKRRFLLEEIGFLSEFKEQAEALNQLARPTQEPQSQLSKLSKKMEKQLIVHLNEEIIFTRRQISLEQINDDSVIQTRIAQNYENSIEQFTHKLEFVEAIVQETEEKKKNKGTVLSNATAPFKQPEYQKLMEENILQKQKIKKILRERLSMSGSIKRLQQKQKNQLIVSKSIHHNFATHHHLTHHKHLYRLSSCQHITKQRRGNQNSKKKLKVPLVLSNFYLKALQEQIFIQELQKIKNVNSKLQMSIALLKQAATQKEEEKILKQLSRDRELDMEQSLAREIFAFRKMSQRFQQKLEKSSYMWVFSSKLAPPNTGSKQQSAQQVRLQLNRREVVHEKRNKSVEKHNGQALFLKADASKSNGKTNCSLQAVHH